jgi:hypothetical protein
MAYQNGFLLRTSMNDVGSVPGHGSYYSSPDIICHEMVSNPQEYFKNNYSKDPNQPAKTSSLTNTLYTRAKNLQNGSRTGYLRLYRARSSLFMNTDQWSSNKLFAPKGSGYVTLIASDKNEISVADDLFSMNGSMSDFCLVGIINTDKSETLPQNFNSYNDFIMWVHSNTGVSVRNLAVDASGTRNDKEYLYNIYNPESVVRSGLVVVKANKLPNGTVYGIKNESLGINVFKTYDNNNPISKEVSTSVTLPDNYQGYVKTYAKVSLGQTWPQDGEVNTEFYIVSYASEEMEKFGQVVNEIILSKEERTLFANSGRLVRIGSCGFTFK